MNAEQKLDYFARVILGEAELTKQKALRKKNADNKITITTALKEAETLIQERTREEIHKIKKARYKQIAAVLAYERKKLHEKQQLLMNHLFLEAEKSLRTFIESETYEAYITKALEQTKQGEFTVVEKIDAKSLGGFILYNESKTKRMDFSFLMRLRKKRESFTPFEYDDV
jgi:vacuolar-type H+-ATPase subunit E/Vma4